MRTPAATVSRLLTRARGKSARELLAVASRRARRVARGAAGELRARAFGAQPSGAELARAVPSSGGTPAGAVARLRATLGRPLTDDREGLARVLARHPDRREALLTAAAAALAGVYDLLGSGPRPLGPTPDWQLDFKSGGRWAPDVWHRRLRAVRFDGSDVKIPWELSRLQHLPALACAHLVSPEAAIPAFFARQVGDWIAKNPPGFGVNWLCTMDVAMRATSLAWGYALLHAELPEPFHEVFLASMLAHGRFIAANLEEGAGNHLLADLSGLAFLAETFPGFAEGSRWGRLARVALEREVGRQIREDGADFEASTGYHRLVFELLLLPALLARRNGHDLSAAYWAKLRAMAVFDAAIQNARGFVPQFGDGDSGRGFRLLPRSELDHGYLNGLAAAALGDASLCAGRPPDAEAAFLTGPEAFERIEAGGGARPGPAAFPGGGVYALRRGPVELFVRCGDTGQGGQGGHAHNDALSFELSLAGERLVVDPGTGSYTGDPDLRNVLRRTAAHSTLAVGGREQSRFDEADLFALPDRVRLLERRLDAERGVFIGRIETVAYRHERRFVLDDDQLAIDDRLEPLREPPLSRLRRRHRGADLRSFELHLPFHPGTRVELASDGAGNAAGPRASVARISDSVEVRFSSSRPLELSLAPAPYASAYGKVEPAPVLRVRGRDDLRMVWRFPAV